MFGPTDHTTPFNELEDDEQPLLTFEDAVALAESINQEAGWTSEVAASGMDDDEYITVQAVFDRFGLIYQVDLESAEEWQYHQQRIDDWQKARKG